MYINNHLKFKVLYNDPRQSDSTFNSIGDIDAHSSEGYRIGGFEVETFSVKHKLDSSGKPTSGTYQVNQAMTRREISESTPVTLTYDVEYITSPLRWATRGDTLLEANPELKQIQWSPLSTRS